MFYNTIHWRLCLLSVYGILTFQFKCPGELHRTLRIKGICKEKTPDHYSCLMDEQSNTFKESCKDSADFVRPGQKYVIGVFRKNIKCELWRYQPFKFWSHKLSRCVFSKSLCNDIGQIMSNLGSSSGDSVCRCDHTRGFAFLSNPKHHCYCVPSNEDCNCYKKTCPLNYILTSDYQCKPSIHEISSCQDVSPVLDTIHTSYITKDVKAIKDFNTTQVAITSTIPFIIVLMIVLFSVISIFCMLGKQSAFKKKSRKYIDNNEVTLQLLRNRLSEPLLYSKGKNDVIVALEIGFTCSGIAAWLWETSEEPLIVPLTWKAEDSCQISNKTSTAILFRPDKTADSIGDDAEFGHYRRNKNTIADCSYFKNFMLTLCKEQEINRDDIAIWDVQKKSRMKAVEIVSSFITNMKHKLLKDIFNGESNTEIQWVFTVPAIWCDKGKQIMSKAAEMAGLSPDKFMLLEEPEAVLKYYSIKANEYPTKLPACYRCIVLQVGDNAINSTIMKVEDDTYTMKTTIFSQYEGVIQEVSNFISDLFGTKVSKHCQKNHPLEYMTLFYSVKKEMKCVQPKTDIKICIPRVWFDIFEDLTTLSDAHMKSHLHQDVDCEGDEMKLKYELFWAFCDNFIQCRLQVIDHILATESVAGIGVLFLAGDFIEPVFVDALKRQYPKHTILVARDPDKVILEGALMSWNEHFLHSSLK